MANAEDGEEEEQDDRRSGGFHYPYGKKANTSGPRLIAGGAAGRGGGVGAGTTTTTTATPAGAGGSGEMEEHSWMSIPVKGGGGGGWGWGSIRASPSKPGSSGGETRGTLAATSANRNTLSTNPTGGSSSGGWRQGLPYASKEGSSTPSTLVDRVHALVSKSFPEDGREAAAASRLALPPVDGTEEEKRRRWKRGGGEGGAGTSSFPTAGGARSTAKASPPALPTRMEGATFRALYPYKARAADELSFEVHSKIVCISRAPEEGWFKGVCNQRTGLFPINYVEPCPEDDD